VDAVVRISVVEGIFTPNDALKGRGSPRAKHAWCDSMIDVGT
jgi:hypothetical protein